MRPSILVAVVIGLVVAGALIFSTRANHKEILPASPPQTDQTAAQSPAPTTPVMASSSNSTPKPMAAVAVLSATDSTEASVSLQTASTNPISKAVDDLLAAKKPEDKHALFQKLVQSGQIDQVIAELKQRAANTTDPEIPTTLGEAQLNKVKALKDSGGDFSEIGILAMQADQSFNSAIKMDPQNWEANFMKSASEEHWPANPQTDNDVVTRLSSLIDQQDTMPAQPNFAGSYLVLGEEYQKLGQPDKAMATWQLGAQKFPNDAALKQKISGQ